MNKKHVIFETFCAIIYFRDHARIDLICFLASTKEGVLKKVEQKNVKNVTITPFFSVTPRDRRSISLHQEER